MKTDRVRPLVAFVLVALACTAVLVSGLQAGPIAGVVRRVEPSGFGSIGSSALLGSVLDVRPGGGAVAHPVVVSFVHAVTPRHTVRSTAAVHRGRAVAKGVGRGGATPVRHPSRKSHHASSVPVVTDRVNVALFAGPRKGHRGRHGHQVVLAAEHGAHGRH